MCTLIRLFSDPYIPEGVGGRVSGAINIECKCIKCAGFRKGLRSIVLKPPRGVEKMVMGSVGIMSVLRGCDMM